MERLEAAQGVGRDVADLVETEVPERDVQWVKEQQSDQLFVEK